MGLYTGKVYVDLSNPNEQTIRIPHSNTIWLPPKAFQNNVAGNVYTNPTGAVVRIRYSLTDDGDIWSLSPGYRNAESGYEFDTIYATVLAGGQIGSLVFMTGVDMHGGYSTASGGNSYGDSGGSQD